jgi:hypothetical protein
MTTRGKAYARTGVDVDLANQLRWRIQYFLFRLNKRKVCDVSTISAILEPDSDGSLHVPLPPELRHRKIKIEAKLEALEDGAALPTASAEMIQQRKEALMALRELGGLRDVIPDPIAWQREQREDRFLPERR